MAAAEKIWSLDEEGMPPEFNGVVDTSDYVPDEEALRESREKNRALVASLGEEFEDLLNLLKA